MSKPASKKKGFLITSLISITDRSTNYLYPEKAALYYSLITPCSSYETYLSSYIE